MNTCAIEIGLRLQSLQWLDRTTFDSKNLGVDRSYVYHLVVNTDKTTPGFDGLVVFRVRNLMLREVDFQRIFADFGTFPPVHYEGDPRSPFDPILPLFKSATDGAPVADHTYSKAWLSLLVDFEIFYRQASGETNVTLVYLRPKVDQDGKPKVVHTKNGDAAAYCPISILPVHTPHSCRTTFATNRQRKGILDLSDAQALLVSRPSNT